MCDVTRSNFKQLLPDILCEIDGASWLAFDCEYTALRPGEPESLLSDTPATRHRRHVAALAGSGGCTAIICQFGLAIFTEEKDDMGASGLHYVAQVYNFFLCPRAAADSAAELFVCQASSLAFLSRHGFDFNRWVSDGLGYLSHHQEAELRRKAEQGVLFDSVSRNLAHEDADKILQLCSQVSNWLASYRNTTDEAPQESMLELVPGDLDRLLLHHTLRRRFPRRIWTFDDDDGGFVVMAISAADRAELEHEESDLDLALRYVDYQRGFSKVLAAIATSNLPLIGHNCVTDFQLIFNQFVRPLPTDYAAFKQQLHQLFPLVYDTKHIVAMEAKRRPRCVEAGTNLERLYAALTQGDCVGSGDLKQACLLTVQLSGLSTRYASGSSSHEAGFDAYLAGVCFIRLAHMMTINSGQGGSITTPDLLRVASQYKNCIRFPRSCVDYIRLDGEDPSPKDLYKVHVTALRGGLDPAGVATMAGRFGCADVSRLGLRTALVTFSSWRTAQDMMRVASSGRSEEMAAYRLEKYSLTQHCGWVRSLLWAGLSLSLIGLTVTVMPGLLKGRLTTGFERFSA